MSDDDDDLENQKLVDQVNIKADFIEEVIEPKPINKESQTETSDTDDINSVASTSDFIERENDILNNIVKMIDEKNRSVYQSKSILELKYNKYKWHYNFWNIITIVLSSSLTFIESAKLVFINDESNMSTIVKNIFTLSPIILGTCITCCASIIKFKKYQEKMEEIYIVIDKCIAIISKLKNKKDEISLLENKEKQIDICKIDENCSENERVGLKTNFRNDIKTLSDSFKNDIINEISSVYIETERYISYKDYHKYLEKINQTIYKKHVLIQDKESFFEEYKKQNKHIMEPKRLNKIKKNVLKKKKVEKPTICPPKSVATDDSDSNN